MWSRAQGNSTVDMRHLLNVYCKHIVAVGQCGAQGSRLLVLEKDIPGQPLGKRKKVKILGYSMLLSTYTPLYFLFNCEPKRERKTALFHYKDKWTLILTVWTERAAVSYQGQAVKTKVMGKIKTGCGYTWYEMI